jgi:hypothetical protein
MAANDGGPAFPRQRLGYYPSETKTHAQDNYTGMSLRDWFAGQALIGLLCDQDDIEVGRYASDDLAAAHAYRMAEAMLAARMK